MRQVKKKQLEIGQLPIAKIHINPKSRDDIPAVLKGLQYLYTTDSLREQVFALLDQYVCADIDRTVGRPGMDLWKILVLAVLKQGLGCDYDRLHELANEHKTLRAMLGHGEWLTDQHQYEMQTLMDNVSLLGPQLLSQIGQLVVQSGHEVARKKPGAPLHGRCDSFVVETDVHYPTDVNLLWDAERCLIRDCAKAAQRCGLSGWRQHEHLLSDLKRSFNRVRRQRQQKRKQRVREYLNQAQCMVDRGEQTLEQLRVCPDARPHELVALDQWLVHARRQIDQVRRRLLQGETIAHEEKVFSIFEPHTRWIKKGKAGVPVELGVPVCIVEDQYQFILHHEIMWAGEDTHIATTMVEQVQARYGEFTLCSFDRGFHSVANRKRLDGMLEHNILPAKGRLSKAARERESDEVFVDARQQHAAVESAINNLEHRGLDRVLSHGREGFERTVALSVLAANVHRIGLLLQRAEREQIRRQRKRLRAA